MNDVVATHEGGHAFVAVALGLLLDRVQIGDDPRYVLARGQRSRRLDRVRVLMGGVAAEEIVFGGAVGGGTDDQQIADLLRDGDDEGALRAEVNRLLALNEGTVRYLAAKLARHDTLTGDEVAALVRCRS